MQSLYSSRQSASLTHAVGDKLQQGQVWSVAEDVGVFHQRVSDHTVAVQHHHQPGAHVQAEHVPVAVSHPQTREYKHLYNADIWVMCGLIYKGTRILIHQ